MLNIHVCVLPNGVGGSTLLSIYSSGQIKVYFLFLLYGHSTVFTKRHKIFTMEV